MEILLKSLYTEIDDQKLNKFQIDILNDLTKYFQCLNDETDVTNSHFETGTFVMFGLHINKWESKLNFTVNNNSYVINSKYFDLYLSDESDFELIKKVNYAVFYGLYVIEMFYNKKGSLTNIKTEFKDEHLAYLNNNEVYGLLLFDRKVSKSEIMEGVVLVH